MNGVNVGSPDEFLDLFEWAWMNVATRCFGHAQLPNEIAMCPLLDLLNHQSEQTKLKFFLNPLDLNLSMLNLELERLTKDEMDLDLQDKKKGFKQETEEGTLC